MPDSAASGPTLAPKNSIVNEFIIEYFNDLYSTLLFFLNSSKVWSIYFGYSPKCFCVIPTNIPPILATIKVQYFILKKSFKVCPYIYNS